MIKGAGASVVQRDAEIAGPEYQCREGKEDTGKSICICS